MLVKQLKKKKKIAKTLFSAQFFILFMKLIFFLYFSTIVFKPTTNYNIFEKIKNIGNFFH